MWPTGRKAKWLSAVFRESMTSFFGKTGMAWHGTMYYVRLESGAFVIPTVVCMCIRPDRLGGVNCLPDR